MDKKISEIKQEFDTALLTDLPALCESYKADNRTGVTNLIIKYTKQYNQWQNELLRTKQMKHYETLYNSYEFLCGIDEAGRGPLAGPVVAGAVILPKDCNLLYINDSKKLSKAKREELYHAIVKDALAYGVGVVSPKEIDRINILQATYEAMRLAIKQLAISPSILLNDAVTIPEIEIEQVPIIKGDAKSISIAAASIIAKVTRDKLMEEYDTIYPEYGFAAHKGYGCVSHIAAIQAHGACPIHRQSFIKNFVK